MLLKQKMGRTKNNEPITIYMVRANDKFKNLIYESNDECEEDHHHFKVLAPAKLSKAKNFKEVQSSVIEKIHGKCKQQGLDKERAGHR